MKIHLHFFVVTVLLSLLIVVQPVVSQQIIFNKVIPPNGNFGGSVGGIAQDRNGYMWFATGGGLYRYDGYRFKIYPLSDTHLETVYIDKEGSIWVATWATGLDRLDPVTGKFTNFKHDPNDPGSLSNDVVRAILEDHKGVLWVGTHAGLDRYDPKTKKFHHYQSQANDLSSLSCDKVRCICEDREGTLWVGTGSAWPGEGGETDEGGLNRFDERTGKFIQYKHDPNNPHSLINNKVRAIFEDSRGDFWVGTAGDGLHRMDRKTGVFERHTYDPAHPEKLSRSPVKRFGDHITFISEDALKNIWIGTLANGISRYDPKTQRTTHFEYADTLAGFTDNSGWCACKSRDGVFWIGTLQGALYRIDPFHKNVTHYSITGGAFDFNADSTGNLWIGTGRGLIFQDRKKGITKMYTHDDTNQASLTNNTINSLFRDNEGILWIGTTNGLNRFNALSDDFTRYYLFDQKDNSRSVFVGAIQQTTGDSLWLVTVDGLIMMNKRTGAFIHFRNDPQDTNSVSGNPSGVLLGERSGDLWAGTAGFGLDYFDHTTRRFRHFLKGAGVSSILRSSSGKLWVGTDVGLYGSDEANNNFEKIDYAGAGIRETNVSSIQEDNQQNIWVGTFAGIFRIDPVKNQTSIYGKSYGIDGRDLTGARYVGLGGEKYYGDIHGYYVFSPDEFIKNPTPPQIVLTNFNVGGKQVMPDAGSILTSSLDSTKKIHLRYDQNVFSFDFAGIHYGSPENNSHLYMLENYDQSWHEAGVEKTASYSNVPPGHYVFHLKCSSSDGVWAEKSVAIIIYPPWWRTWWAYSLYGLLFILLAFSVPRYQKDRVLKAERERTRAKELAQAKEIEKAYNALKATQAQLIQSEKMASLGELTAGVAHEIQNPLNFVNNFSDVNTELIDEANQQIDKGNINEVKAILNDLRDNEQKINNHGKRADAIVKGMLQHSRTSTGQREPTDINALCDEYLRLAYHGLRAKDKNFNAEIKTEFDETVGKINVVPQDIGRVILNLLNNAFYAVAERQKVEGLGYEPIVTVSTKKLNGKVEIKVNDNGNGIPQKLMDKIFQPFFTTKPTGQGTGLGLSLAYDIIKAHGGEIKVQTKEGEGSEFVIQLPTH